jgi:hypothetical protein
VQPSDPHSRPNCITLRIPPDPPPPLFPPSSHANFPPIWLMLPLHCSGKMKQSSLGCSPLTRTCTCQGVPAPSCLMMLSPQGFNFRHALSELAAYQAEHPDFAAGVGIWMTVGTILLVFGLIIFLFSEIKAVLVCRDQVC